MVSGVSVTVVANGDAAERRWDSHLTRRQPPQNDKITLEDPQFSFCVVGADSGLMWTALIAVRGRDGTAAASGASAALDILRASEQPLATHRASRRKWVSSQLNDMATTLSSPPLAPCL